MAQTMLSGALAAIQSDEPQKHPTGQAQLDQPVPVVRDNKPAAVTEPAAAQPAQEKSEPDEARPKRKRTRRRKRSNNAPGGAASLPQNEAVKLQ